MKPKIFIGIDVSKDKLDIAVKAAAAETGGAVSPAKRAAEKWTAANTKAGCDALVRRLEVMQPERIAMEATGGYERAAQGARGAPRAGVCASGRGRARCRSRCSCRTETGAPEGAPKASPRSSSLTYTRNTSVEDAQRLR